MTADANINLTYGLTQNTIEQICQVFKQYPTIQQVLLYGSRAKGTFRNGSDIDLTILSDQLSNSDLMSIRVKLDNLDLPYLIDLSLKHQIEESALHHHIEQYGKVFFESADSAK